MPCRSGPSSSGMAKRPRRACSTSRDSRSRRCCGVSKHPLRRVETTRPRPAAAQDFQRSAVTVLFQKGHSSGLMRGHTASLPAPLPIRGCRSTTSRRDLSDCQAVEQPQYVELKTGATNGVWVSSTLFNEYLPQRLPPPPLARPTPRWSSEC